jgi:hypothetical protein
MTDRDEIAESSNLRLSGRPRVQPGNDELFSGRPAPTVG